VHPEDTSAADLDTLTWLVNPPAGLERAVRDTDGLRAHGGLLVLLNLLADLAPPLDAGDVLSAQIARISGEIVPWLFPPWGLRTHVVPAVRDFPRGRRGVRVRARRRANASTKPPSYACARLQVGDQEWWQRASNFLALSVSRRFAKLVEELRALAVFVFDEPQHACCN